MLGNEFGQPLKTDGGITVYRRVLDTSSTADAGAFSWQNIFNRPVYAQPRVFFETAGTGTLEIGTGSSQAGSSTTYLAAGTMAVGAPVQNQMPWLRIAKNGTAGDSIVAKLSDTTASTAVGTAYIYVIVA